MSIKSSLENRQVFSKLGRQEKRVLLLLSEDRSDQKIAKAVFLGEATICNYVNSILSKLGLKNRDEAITYALKHKLRGHLGYGD